MISLPSSEETAALLARELLSGDGNVLVLMNGAMGSGKTTFTRMLGKALGLSSNITSPTFVGLHEYRGSDFDLLHFDIYQVGISYYDLKELMLLNPERKKIMVVEWGEKLGEKTVAKLRDEGVGVVAVTFCKNHFLELAYNFLS